MDPKRKKEKGKRKRKKIKEKRKKLCTLAEGQNTGLHLVQQEHSKSWLGSYACVVTFHFNTLILHLFHQVGTACSFTLGLLNRYLKANS